MTASAIGHCHCSVVCILVYFLMSLTACLHEIKSKLNIDLIKHVHMHT